MKKKLILGLTATAAVAAPVVAVVSCGDQSIKTQNTKSTSTEATWTPSDKTIEELKVKIEELTKEIEQLKAAGSAAAGTSEKMDQIQNLLSETNKQLQAQMSQAKAASLETTFASALQPFTSDNWKSEEQKLKDFTSLTSAQDFVKGHVASELEKSVASEINKQFSSTSFVLETKIKDAFGVLTNEAINLSPDNIFAPVSDSDESKARDLTEVKLDDSFNSLPTDKKATAILDALFGQNERNQRNGGLLPTGFVGNVPISPEIKKVLSDQGAQASDIGATADADHWAFCNGVSKLVFSIDEKTNTLKVWTIGRIGVPTLDDEISKVNKDWQKDADIVAEIAKIGLTATSPMTPENYMKVIRYFLISPSAEAAAAFDKAHPWMNGYKWSGDAEGNAATMKLTSPLSWALDDYTMTNLGLAENHVIKKDGSSVRFDNPAFYTTSTADQYDAEMWKDQFETYNGKLVAKTWIFEHIFMGQNHEDGSYDGNRYHSYYDSQWANIAFMKNNYQLLVTTHASASNPADQILDFALKFNSSQQIVYRDSMVLHGMQPDARHMFEGKDDAFFANQDVISKDEATKTITVEDFMASLVKAQAALKTFSNFATSHLNDLLIAKLIDAISAIDLTKISYADAEKLLTELRNKTDINLNWFVSTLSKDESYITMMLLSRGNHHYALSLTALQFDNVINTVLDIARIATPESFTHGDLSHI